MNSKLDAEKFYQKGFDANQAKNFNTSVVSFSRAIKLNKVKIQYHEGMAYAFVEQAKYKEAVIIYKRIIIMDPEDPAAYRSSGYVLDILGKIEESIKMYKEAIRLNPDDVDVHENIAIPLSKKERYEEAQEHYRAALKIKPADAYKIASGTGCIYFHQGMFVKAMEEFKKSISLNKKFTDAYWNMSLVLFCEKEHKRAVEYFESGIDILGEDEDNKIATIKHIIASFTEHRMRIEARLNNSNNDDGRGCEEQIKLLRIMIDGLTKIINLANTYLEN